MEMIVHVVQSENRLCFFKSDTLHFKRGERERERERGGEREKGRERERERETYTHAHAHTHTQQKGHLRNGIRLQKTKLLVAFSAGPGI